MGEWFSVVVFAVPEPLAHRRAMKLRVSVRWTNNPNKVTHFDPEFVLRAARSMQVKCISKRENAAEQPEPDSQLLKQM